MLVLRFGAVTVLATGVALWMTLHAGHPLWLDLSAGLYGLVVVLIAVFLEPATREVSRPSVRTRVRVSGAIAAALICGIAVLMVVRPGHV